MFLLYLDRHLFCAATLYLPLRQITVHSSLCLLARADRRPLIVERLALERVTAGYLVTFFLFRPVHLRVTFISSFFATDLDLDHRPGYLPFFLFRH